MNTGRDPLAPQPPETAALPPSSSSSAETAALPPSSPLLSGATTASSPLPTDAAKPPAIYLSAPTESAAASFRVRGYEILGELGRGGMGVVYKARQTTLKRFVAVKVIRGAAQAGPDELQRFRVEAEAVARLQHQHIVQIYEVGEQEGTPYCVLEFVDGGSLAQRLADKPLPTDETARLLEALARAVAYAHQRQVIHRDLKPANVLLTAAGEPKITDFGLAKQLDDDSGQTRTGQIMGSPSYMSPEQAAGDQNAIGPRTDVYALGAILYEMLAGQPPFKGPNVAATLQQVQTQDPTPPTRLNPKAPRDLETICLKCLHKDPARRYGSALQMAQDLERFRNGEAILARPENVVRKLARKLRRRWPLLAVGVALAIALVVGWFAFSGGRYALRASELGQQLEAGLAAQPADWSGGHVDQQEGRIAELATLAPQQAAGWRDRLRQKFGEAVAARIRQPRLEAEERDRIEELLQEYAKRWPEEEHDLRAQFQHRLRDWQDVCTVAAPFTGWETALPAANVKAEKDGLVLAPNAGSVVLTTCRCEGSEEIQAAWDESWTAAPKIGLTLNTTTDGRGYTFLLTTTSCFHRQDDPPPPATLADALQKEGQVYVQIWRDGLCLREDALAPPGGPLTLVARRQGDQVDFQVGASKPQPFVDAFPPPPAQGNQGLFWPPGPRLTSLKCRRQTLPQTPSPLERADDLFSRGRHAEALSAYEQESLTAGTTFGPEARYKAALCLVEMNRPDDAADRLERVAGESGERWPVLAAFRLLLMRFQQGRSDKVEEAFQNLAARIRPEDVALLLPVQTRTNLAGDLAGRRFGVNFLLANEETSRQAERSVKGFALLQAPPETLGEQYRALIRCRWMVGQTDQAAKDADAWIKQCEQLEPPPRRVRSACFVLLDRSWLSRTVGPPETRRTQARKAMDELDRWLVPNGPLLEASLSEQYARYLVERARLQIALEDWAGAEKDLTTCLRLSEDPAQQVSYAAYADAHLLDGFVHQRHNDPEGMRRTWKQGTYSSYQAQHSVGSRGGDSSFFDLYMALKTGDVEDADIARILDEVLSSSSDPTTSQFAKLAGITHSTLRHAIQSARCDDFMRRFALGELSFPQTMRGPMRLIALQLWCDGAFGGNLSADQEAVLWPLTDDLTSMYASNGGAKRLFMQMGMAWLGSTGFLGWGSIAPELKPALRGPLAYVLGRRLLTLQKPADAEMLFRTAVADAPADSSLRRLAQVELDRLKAK